MYDVAVVGAGPAGLRCAGLCDRAGLKAVVIERKPEIGLPVQCSGLISTNLDRFVKPPDACIENRVRGAVVHGPGGMELNLRKPGLAAYVIERSSFDRFLAEQVESEIRLKTSVERLVFRNGVRISTSQGEVRARTLLGCDGPSSVVRRHFGVRPHEMLQGIMAVRREQDSSDFVELWLDRRLCDGFLWRIPRGDSVEYGMMGSRARFELLERFFRLGRDYEKRAGIIPVGPCKSYFERALLVGDSAGQTKPWSGGGVVYSLTCAGHAVEALEKALASGELSEKALSAYEEAWKEELDRPICMGMMARELYKEMSGEQLKGLFRKLASMELNSLDMDFPVLDF